ncbi:hypothetical protein ACA910_004356 [Epithemia clementina (nom. ined.)]
MARACTCCNNVDKSPPQEEVFDITDVFLKSLGLEEARDENATKLTPPTTTTTTTTTATKEESFRTTFSAAQPRQQQLSSTLAHYGWALVQLRPCAIQNVQQSSRSAAAAAAAALSPRLWHDPTSWKGTLLHLFEHNNETVVPGGTYRQAESGSPDQEIYEIEPKESWEVQRCHANQNNDKKNKKTKNNIAARDHHETKENHKHVLETEQETRQQNEHQQQQQQQQHVLYDWISLLHQIAISVRMCLELPPNVLLQENENDDDDKNDNDGAIDLLRAFYYHTVEAKSTITKEVNGAGSCSSPKSVNTNNDHDECGNEDDDDDDDEDSHRRRILGSSPHTDWGSLTVVWQDDVGGLETYCHACRKWNSVPPPPSRLSSSSSSSRATKDKTNLESAAPPVVSFVVHISDLTSLALGLAASNTTTSITTTCTNPNGPKRKTNEEDPTDTDCHYFGAVDWPSPRHRVVSPTHESRVSLVYFAYPPPHLSLAQVVQFLQHHAQVAPNSVYLQSTSHSSYCSGNKDPTTPPQQQQQQPQQPNTRRRVLPLDDYYLLQNQSSARTQISDENSNNDTSDQPRPAPIIGALVVSPKDQLDRILQLPLRDVLMDKWNQVQRSQY